METVLRYPRAPRFSQYCCHYKIRSRWFRVTTWVRVTYHNAGWIWEYGRLKYFTLMRNGWIDTTYMTAIDICRLVFSIQTQHNQVFTINLPQKLALPLLTIVRVANCWVFVLQWLILHYLDLHDIHSFGYPSTVCFFWLVYLSLILILLF